MKFIAAFLAFMFLSLPALAGISLIRDAEVEKTLRDYVTPIFETAGLNPDAVNIYIINDKSINAFVVGGMNMFIHTGLIMKSEDANMLIGVMAHETGHISGGHIIKREGEMEDLTLQTALSAVLGAAVSIAGLPDAGVAIAAGGQHLATRDILQYSREQEVAADQAGMNYLRETGQSAEGLLKVMQILRRDQTLNYNKIDPYTISHPLTKQRMAQIRSVVEEEKGIKNGDFDVVHKRMVAKLDGFIEEPSWIFDKYKDESVPSIYARSVAHFRQSNLKSAIVEIDKLIAMEPDDPFFNELKGQMLFENGKIAESIPYYEKAVKEYPDSGLLKYDLGKIYLANNQLNSAIKYLSQSTKIEPRNGGTWRLLATAYGKQNNDGMMNLTLAEEANLLNKKGEALRYAKLAKGILNKNTASYLRANDLINEIKYKKKLDE